MFVGLVGKGDTAFVLAPVRTLEINLSEQLVTNSDYPLHLSEQLAPGSQITLSSIRLSLSTSSQCFDGEMETFPLFFV